MILSVLFSIAVVLLCGYLGGLAIAGLALLYAGIVGDASGDFSLGIGTVAIFWPYVLYIRLREEIKQAWKESAR